MQKIKIFPGRRVGVRNPLKFKICIETRVVPLQFHFKLTEYIIYMHNLGLISKHGNFRKSGKNEFNFKIEKF